MKQKAFTLTEIILVVALIAIILIAIYPYIRSIRETWTYSDRRSEILQHARVALDKIVRDIRNAKRITEIDPSIISPGQFIEIINQDYDTVTIFHNVDNDNEKYIEPQGDIQDNDLVVQTEDREGNPVYNVLAKSVDYFRLYYLKDTMDPNDEAEDPEEVVAVRIDMRVSDPEGILTGTIPVTSLTYVRAPDTMRPGTWCVALDIVKYDLKGREYFRITNNGYGFGWGLQTNIVDGSCWATVYEEHTGKCRLIKLNAKGKELFRIGEFKYHPDSMDIDTTDGACWVGDQESDRVIKYNSDGNEPPLFIVDEMYNPRSLSVDSNDGTCWIADRGLDPKATGGVKTSKVVKLNSEGQLICKVDDYVNFIHANLVSVDIKDGACWISDYGAREVLKVHYDESTDNFRILAKASDFAARQGFGIHSIAADARDGSCLVSDQAAGQVIRVDSEGNKHVLLNDVMANSISINQIDGSFWIANGMGENIEKYDANGEGPLVSVHALYCARVAVDYGSED